MIALILPAFMAICMGIDSRVVVLTYVPSRWLMMPSETASSNDICSSVRGFSTPAQIHDTIYDTNSS